jgi:hypothetical protein
MLARFGHTWYVMFFVISKLFYKMDTFQSHHYDNI